MLHVLRVHLPSDIPIVGCELSPYVLLRRPDSSSTTDDVTENSPLDGYFLRCRWYRSQGDKRVAVCSVHPTEPATLQCLECSKLKLPGNKSYHCSSQCFKDSWKLHRAIHAYAASIIRDNPNEDDEPFYCFNSTGSAVVGKGTGPSNTGHPNGSSILGSTDQVGVEPWYEVGQGKTYTPTVDDVGHVLKLECVIVDAAVGSIVTPAKTLLTARVIPAPSPTPRCMIPVNLLNGLTSDMSGSVGTFTVLSYNVLADLYATSELYSYCPPWALSWSYRRQNLLREISGYRADIICLQEVQSDHYLDFFAPELEKLGYTSVYKKKTAEVYTGTVYAIDGCATFFRRDRFALVKKYEVEFNRAAQSLSEVLVPPFQKKATLSRLLKDNVALIVVLEVKEMSQGAEVSNPGKRQLLCVANTHLNANPELKDVKLWQVNTLLKGLEKIAESADIPMLVCGDFNSVPGSAPHLLLATGRVDPSHPELSTDPLGILRPVSKLSHHLPLVSAYSAFVKLGAVPGFEQQQRRMDTSNNEPVFTNCTRDFLGTLDYIFYTADSLLVESLLELLDEESLRKDTALPSPEWSSDHIALLVKFRIKQR
eukprot:c28921_g1_i1 orf=356-2137(+)